MGEVMVRRGRESDLRATEVIQVKRGQQLVRRAAMKGGWVGR